MAGFSLVELMLSLSLGLALSGVMLQGLMAEGRNGARFSQLLRERAAQRRTLELVKGDLVRATAVSTSPEQEAHACALAGRVPVLHLNTPAGPITYSVGAAPSSIWRGRVLMRCGPAFGLDGELSAEARPQNRVVLDGLTVSPLSKQPCHSLLDESQPSEWTLISSRQQGSLIACVNGDSDIMALQLSRNLSSAVRAVTALSSKRVAHLTGSI